MTITVGVVIPVYNRPDDVIAALRSVEAQTRPADQIVIVDDGSTRPVTLPEPGPSGRRPDLIRLKVNSGAAAARQAGIESLQTSHVAFLDADDSWLPQKLERQIAYLQSRREQVMTAVACGWTWVDAKGCPAQTVLPQESDRLSDFASGCWYSPGSTVLMSKEALTRIGGFDASLRRLEDLDLFLRFAAGGGRLAVAPFTGARIRRGFNARLSEVSTAAGIIRGKFLKPGSPVVYANVERRLQSWLSLEEAAAARNQGRWLSCAHYLSRSFVQHPRLSLHLQNWWTVLPTPG